MKNTLRAIAMSTVFWSAVTAAAGPLSYTYLSAAYGKSFTDSSPGDLEGDIAGADLSIDIGETGVALNAGYEAGRIETDILAGVYKQDDKAAYLGMLYHHPATDATDLVFGFSVGRELSETRVNGDTTRWFYIGVRGMALNSLELRARLERGQYNDGFGTAIRLGSSYYIVKRISFDIDYLDVEYSGGAAGSAQTYYGGLTFYFD